MSGLNYSQGFYPTGYNDPKKPSASFPLPPPIAPSEYNRGALKPPKSANLHVPIGVYNKYQWPDGKVSNNIDSWNNTNASTELPSPTPPSEYNKNALKSNYNKTTPIPSRWTKQEANQQTEESAVSGTLQKKPDIIDIAKSFIETSFDPVQKDWWQRRTNSLIQLRTIETQRSLSPEEQSLKDRIVKELDEKSKNTSNISNNISALTDARRAAEIRASTTANLRSLAANLQSQPQPQQQQPQQPIIGTQKLQITPQGQVLSRQQVKPSYFKTFQTIQDLRNLFGVTQVNVMRTRKEYKQNPTEQNKHEAGQAEYNRDVAERILDDAQLITKNPKDPIPEEIKKEIQFFKPVIESIEQQNVLAPPQQVPEVQLSRGQQPQPQQPQQPQPQPQQQQPQQPQQSQQPQKKQYGSLGPPSSEHKMLTINKKKLRDEFVKIIENTYKVHDPSKSERELWDYIATILFQKPKPYERGNYSFAQFLIKKFNINQQKYGDDLIPFVAEIVNDADILLNEKELEKAAKFSKKRVFADHENYEFTTV